MMAALVLHYLAQHKCHLYRIKSNKMRMWGKENLRASIFSFYFQPHNNNLPSRLQVSIFHRWAVFRRKWQRFHQPAPSSPRMITTDVSQPGIICIYTTVISGELEKAFIIAFHSAHENRVMYLRLKPLCVKLDTDEVFLLKKVFYFDFLRAHRVRLQQQLLWQLWVRRRGHSPPPRSGEKRNISSLKGEKWGSFCSNLSSCLKCILYFVYRTSKTRLGSLVVFIFLCKAASAHRAERSRVSEVSVELNTLI